MEQKRFYVFKANASSRSSENSAPNGEDGGPGERVMSIAHVERSKPVHSTRDCYHRNRVRTNKRNTNKSVTRRKLEIPREDLDDVKANAASSP